MNMKLSFSTVRSISGLLVCLTIFLATSINAQDVTTESDFFEDAPLILTASRMSKPLMESPASVSVIDRQMIKAAGIRKLADIFRLVPGFIVGNLSGNTPIVTYQGQGAVFARQIQVLVDGRSVFIPSFGGVPWVNLPLLLEDIERVEVIRGPNAVTYGANAFLATINIITRHAAEDLGARYSLTASDSTNPNVRDAYFRLGYHFDDIDWRLSIGTLKDDGFETVNDSRETDKLNFRLDYLANNNQFWTIQLGTSNTISGKGSPGSATNQERNEDATNSYLNINWEQVRISSSTSIRLTHTEQKVIDNYQPEPFSIGPISNVTTFIDFDRLSNRTDLEIIQTEEFDIFRIVYGTSFREDRVKSKYLLNSGDFHDIHISRLFTSMEWRFAQDWILDLGTTLEDSSITDQEYSPRLSLLHNLTENHMLRFVASRAKRNPILFEYSGLTIFSANGNIPGPGMTDFDMKIWQGNPNIVPEDLISYEIGLRSQYADSAISSDVKLFSYRITDYIDETSFNEAHPYFVNISVGTSENTDGFRVNGLEASYNITPISDLDIKTGVSFVSIDTENSDIKESYPEASAFITAQYEWQSKHSISASYYYIDEMIWLHTPSNTTIPSINKLDLRYSHLLDESSETRIEIIGQNMLEDYIDSLQENINERVYLLRISGGF